MWVQLSSTLINYLLMSPSVKKYLFNKKGLGFGINQRWVHKRSVKKNVTSKETVCVADDVRFSIVS